MKKLLLFLLLLSSSLSKAAKDFDMQSIYQQIDEAIDHSPEYVADYEHQIEEKRRQYIKAATPEEKYLLAYQLYEYYKAFMNDSALWYIDEAEQWAIKQGNQARAGNCRVLRAFQCSTVGYYSEALTFLNSVDKSRLDSVGLKNYYLTQMHVYGELGYYSKIRSMQSGYYKNRSLYRDSLFAMVSHDSPDYLMNRIYELREQNQLTEARALCDKWMKQVDPESRDFAIVSYYCWLSCEDVDEAKYWLALSALSDVRNAVMDQASLLSLADILNGEGDLDRSYKYIRFTWDCNNRFNTRMRSWQITPILNVIENNYQTAVARNTRGLWTSVVVVSILAVLLLGVLFFLHRRNKQLDAARNALKASNSQLSTANAQLSTANSQLSDLNSQLSVLNSQLSESNRVKEEYIGRFMSLCSQYIDKLDDYRKMVNKKMKNKELEELFRLSKSTELKERELEELFLNFDSVFLHLFPNFVNDFNSLLQPEMQVQPKEDNRLTTEIRIFALIRLGIEDSSKIAEFLHYSVNTIYNYRARIKNGAIGNREQFERQIKTL
jgi:hypothetical protein